MKEQSPPRRPSRAIRRQLLVGSLGLGLLILLAGASLVWQVNRLDRAVAEFQAASERATAATVIQRDSAELSATITRLLPVENAAAFEDAVSGVLDQVRQGLRDLTGVMGGDQSHCQDHDQPGGMPPERLAGHG